MSGWQIIFQTRIAQENVEAHKNKLHFKKELEWMRRQPKARTTKSKSRIEDFKIIKEKASQRRNEHQVQLEINMERLGSKMIEMHKVQKSFGEKIILSHFNYSFQRSERIGIIGKNGSGKVVLRSAPAGTGIIAGGPIRSVCEVLGIQDIVAKSLGSAKPHNVLKACVNGLKSQSSPKFLSAIRGKKISDIVLKREAE